MVAKWNQRNNLQQPNQSKKKKERKKEGNLIKKGSKKVRRISIFQNVRRRSGWELALIVPFFAIRHLLINFKKN